MRSPRNALLCLSFLVVLLAVPGISPAHADEATELQRLADQAFQVLHNVSVQLPGGTYERVARSSEPSGQLQDLVRKQYIDEFFLGRTLNELDEGWLAVFRNDPEGFDVAVEFRRDSTG